MTPRTSWKPRSVTTRRQWEIHLWPLTITLQTPTPLYFQHQESRPTSGHYWHDSVTTGRCRRIQSLHIHWITLKGQTTLVTETPQKHHGPKYVCLLERTPRITVLDLTPTPDDFKRVCEKGVLSVKVDSRDVRRKRKTRNPQRTLKKQPQITRKDL